MNRSEWIKAAFHEYDSGNLEEAEQAFKKTVELFDNEKDDPRQLILCLNKLEELCISLNKPRAALSVSREKLSILEQYSESIETDPDLLSISDSSKSDLRSIEKAGFESKRNLLVVTLMIVSFSLSVYLVNLFISSPSTKLIEQRSNSAVSPQAGDQFKTVDKIKVIGFMGNSEAYLWNKGKITGAKYDTIKMNLFDLSRMVPGCLRKNENYYQRGNNYLVDKNGTIFYSTEAPEFFITNRMWDFAGLVVWHYKKYKCNPENSKSLEEATEHLWYLNPFTGHREYAKFVERSLLPEPRPGAIVCVTGPPDVCRVIGYDRHGEPISSSTSGKDFEIIIKKGENLTEQYLKKFGQRKVSVDEEHLDYVYLVDDFWVKDILEDLELYIPVIACPLLLLSLASSFFILLFTINKKNRILVICTTVIPVMVIILLLIMGAGN